jgi:hypothetical protein
MRQRGLLRTVLAVTAFAVSAPAPAAEHGPRVSDAELLAALDPAVSGLGEVLRLRDEGKADQALSALAAFVRARQEPKDYGQRAPRNARYTVGRAEEVLRHRFVVERC